MPAIEASDLSKIYRVSERPEGVMGSVRGLFHRRVREVAAVRGVTFTIEKGELVAFLGPNGAGKTTTMKMLSGLIYPSGGSLRVLDQIPFDKKTEFLRRFSFVMGQRHQLWWELPALDTFRLNAAIFELSDRRYQARLKELDDLLELDPLWNTPVKKLSLGQRMKMELACSLIHDPELLLLDEPTIGLDVVMQKTLRDFIARINREQKTTVLLTSHNMEDIESLCRRVIVIHHGTLLFDGELTELVARFVPCKRVSAVLSSPVALSELKRFGDVKEDRSSPLPGRALGPAPARDSHPADGAAEAAPRTVEWDVPRGEVSRRVAEILNGLPVMDLTVEEMALEDVVRRIFREGTVIGAGPGR